MITALKTVMIGHAVAMMVLAYAQSVALVSIASILRGLPKALAPRIMTSYL